MVFHGSNDLQWPTSRRIVQGPVERHPRIVLSREASKIGPQRSLSTTWSFYDLFNLVMSVYMSVINFLLYQTSLRLLWSSLCHRKTLLKLVSSIWLPDVASCLWSSQDVATFGSRSESMIGWPKGGTAKMLEIIQGLKRKQQKHLGLSEHVLQNLMTHSFLPSRMRVSHWPHENQQLSAVLILCLLILRSQKHSENGPK